MKIGDKVRFLNEVGGGVVTGFVGNNLVNVEDENGFDIPVPIREVVVIETDKYNIPVAQNKKEEKAEKIEDEVPIEKPVTFKPAPVERKEGEKLNLYLCFVPVNVSQLQETDFEAYLVNDSNYFVDYLFMKGENTGWDVVFRGTLEPNTKGFLQTVERESLNELEHLAFQFLFYKQGKTFLLKPAMTIRLKPDLSRFYKLHTFVSNDFFEERVQTFNLVRDDKPEKNEFVNAEEVRAALLGGKKTVETKPEKPNTTVEKASDIKEVDLHASEVLETTAGMASRDILEYQLKIFNDAMLQYKAQKGKKIVFIHGKGNGVLRKELLVKLRHDYPHCSSQDASFREYGFGATMVTIH